MELKCLIKLPVKIIFESNGITTEILFERGKKDLFF